MTESTQLTPAASEADSSYPSPRRAGYTLALLIFAILIAYIDRQILALLVTPIKSAFDLSDTRIGALQGPALNLCLGLAALPLGLLVDRSSRVRLIGFAAITWSVFTVLSGLSSSFWQLFACRMGIGIAEAGLAPAAYSLIADLYPPRTRTVATLVFLGATLLAASVGVALGGATIEFISDHLRSLPLGLASMPVWRLTFIAAALPGPAFLVLFLSVTEPTRKTERVTSTAQNGEISLVDFMRANWITIICLCGGLTMAAIGVDALLTWMPAILGRDYGLPPGRSGEWLGLIWGVGSLSGLAVAGGLTRALRRRWGALAQLQVLRIGAFSSALVLPGFLLVQRADQLLTVTLVYFVLGYTAYAVGPGLVMVVAPNHLRGRIYAIFTFVSVIAAAIWPPLVGALSDQIFHGSRGLLLALLAVIIPCGFAAAAMLAIIVDPFRRTTNVAAAPDETGLGGV